MLCRWSCRMSTRVCGKERRPELLTPADPNPPQPTRSAFPQCPAAACVLLTQIYSKLF